MNKKIWLITLGIIIVILVLLGLIAFGVYLWNTLPHWLYITLAAIDAIGALLIAWWFLRR